MPPLQFFRVFINERLIAAAAEIFEAVEKTVTEYQEENDHLRRLLRISPELKLCGIDSLQLSVSEEEVPPEQQHCEQEWSPSLGQEVPEPTQIKEEQEELRTSQEEEQLREVENDILYCKFNLPCVKSECDQENPLWSLTPPQTQTEENRESDSKPVDLKPLDTVTHLKDLDLPCYPQDNQNNQRADVRRDPGRFDLSPPLDPSPPLDASPPLDPRPPLDASPLPHTSSREFTYSKQFYSSFNPNAHVRHCQFEEPCSIWRKTFKYKGTVSEHTKIQMAEKPLSCGNSGKSFSQKKHLSGHKVTHRGEKQFSCGDCGKCFTRKGHLFFHKLTHTGEKPFSCGDCGKSFRQKSNLTNHKLTHTSEKPFSCVECGKSFSRKDHLTYHKLTHTGEKPFSCDECGKRYRHKVDLRRHHDSHRRETTQL